MPGNIPDLTQNPYFYPQPHGLTFTQPQVQPVDWRQPEPPQQQPVDQGIPEVAPPVDPNQWAQEDQGFMDWLSGIWDIPDWLSTAEDGSTIDQLGLPPIELPQPEPIMPPNFVPGANFQDANSGWNSWDDYWNDLRDRGIYFGTSDIPPTIPPTRVSNENTRPWWPTPQGVKPGTDPFGGLMGGRPSGALHENYQGNLSNPPQDYFSLAYQVTPGDRLTGEQMASIGLAGNPTSGLIDLGNGLSVTPEGLVVRTPPQKQSAPFVGGWNNDWWRPGMG